MAHAGFDRADCPDLALMQRLWDETNLEWCGFYLPAPSQPGATWRGKRAPLVAQGWGLAPIFVGQQVTGPGSHNVTAAQGDLDGAATASALRAEGFPSGTRVWLDLENGPPFGMAQQAYVAAWEKTVRENGFRTGIYCSFLFAAQALNLCPEAQIWVYHVATTQQHRYGGDTFPTPEPGASGFPGATIWQNQDEAIDDRGIIMDLDSATTPDPGAPSVS